jgi:beta-lactamase class A
VKLNLPAIIRHLLKPQILMILILVPFTLWVYLDVIFPHPPQSPLAYTTPRKKPLVINKKSQTQKQTALTKLIDSELSKLDGDYALIVKDLTSDVAYSKNEDREFTSASIYKLAVMYKIYDLIENQSLNPQQEVYPGLTVKKALDLMITVSDNDSALALAQMAGWDNIQSALEKDSITGFHLTQEEPQVTAKAVDQLLEKIYFNKAISQNASQEMKQLLLAQNIDDRIPKYLPSDIQVAHKTGELDFVRHDVGIVYGKKSDYIFIFLTETPAPGDTVENIANLSKTIYNFLEN